MSATLVDKVVYLYQRGLKVWEIAMALGVRRRTVERALGIWCRDYQRGLGAAPPSPPKRGAEESGP
jgi:hypothetical protein